MKANGKEARVARRKSLNLTAVIYHDADSDWLVAHNPETGTTTQGRTFEEALANLKEATELYLSGNPAASCLCLVREGPLEESRQDVRRLA